MEEREGIYTAKDFVNTGSNTFIDISSELYRIYDFGNGLTVKVMYPLLISIKNTGHRIFDSNGMCHYIPSGWIHLKWFSGEEGPHFVK